MNNIFHGTMEGQPHQSDDLTCLLIPDEIARELESSDELYFWSSDGTTLISEDGKKTIPSSVSTQKDEAHPKQPNAVNNVVNNAVNIIVNDAQGYHVKGINAEQPAHKSPDSSFDGTKQLGPTEQLIFFPCLMLNTSIHPVRGKTKVNPFNGLAYVERGSLGLLISSLNLALLFWFWFTG